MPKWPTSPLGKLCDLINGRAFKPSDWGKSGLPIVRIQNLNDPTKPFNYYDDDYKEKHFIDDGDILLSWSGTPGTSFGCFRWMRGPALLNQHIFKVIVEDNVIDGDFFIYAVNSKLDEMIRQAHGGVGLRHITKKKLEAIYLPIPPLDEQRRIVARIKKCMERVEEIEELRAEAIDKSEKLSFAVARDFFKALEQDIGTTKLSEFAEINPRRPRELAQQMSRKECTFVPMDAVNASTGNIEKAITKAFEEVKRGFTYFVNNDVIFAKITPCMQNGKCAVARDLVNGVGFGSTEFHVIRPSRSLLPDWIWLYLRLPEVRADAQRNFRGSAGQQRVPKEWLLSLELPIPSLDKQKEICRQLIDMTMLAQQVRQEVSEATTESLFIRESILRKAFAGEL